MLPVGPLQERNFRFYFLAQLTSWFGDAMVWVALAFAVLDLTGSVADLGYVLSARSVALLGMLVFGGVLADRLPRRAIMLGADVARFASQGTVAFLLVSGHAQIWHFIVAQFVHGIATALFNPASSGLVPQIVPSEQLQQANALRGLTSSMAMIVGPSVAGLCVATLGSGYTLAIDALTFAVSAVFLSAVRLPPRLPQTRQRFVRDLVDGWVEFRSRTWVWVLVGYASLTNMLFSAFVVLGPLVSKQSLGGAGAWGAILSSFGIGSAVGGLLALRLRTDRPLRFAVLASVLFALPPIGLAAGLSLFSLIALALVGGIGLMVFNTLWETAMQRSVPQEVLSRVSAYEGFGTNACQPVGQASAGPLAGMIGACPTLWITGACQLAVAALVFTVPSVREFRTSVTGRVE